MDTTTMENPIFKLMRIHDQQGGTQSNQIQNQININSMQKSGEMNQMLVGMNPIMGTQQLEQNAAQMQQLAWQLQMQHIQQIQQIQQMKEMQHILNQNQIRVPGGKNIFFRKNGENAPPLMIQCIDNEKVSVIIKRYRTKANDYDKSKRFIFNAKQLNESLTVAEAGLTDNSNIFVVTTEGVKGGY